MLERSRKKFINIGGGKPLIWEYLPESFTRQSNQFPLNTVLNLEKKVRIEKWYWPHGARSFFSFRADMDEGNEGSLLRFLDAMAPWHKSLSLFVCGKAYIGKERLLQKISELNVEVGNHTYTHYVFSSKDKNRINLELTERLLTLVAIDPKGYVGPASFFHKGMYGLLEEKGYEYTSSFGLSHDGFPFFPRKNNSATYRMVEIPFHCLGDRFPKFGISLDSDTVRTFFEQLLEKKYHRCEPMFIYGHPDMPGRMGDHPDLVKCICEKALSFDDVSTGNMADIAAWWKRRHDTVADISYERDNNLVVAKNYHGSEDVYWSIQVAEDCKYVVSGEQLQKGIRLDGLESYKKIDLTEGPYSEIGSVIESPAEKISLRTKIGNLRREYRRKRRMIHELKRAYVEMEQVDVL
jgi:peptidoglycan/xylan/chitin deacetylase (PgdA/CDA1 family)